MILSGFRIASITAAGKKPSALLPVITSCNHHYTQLAHYSQRKINIKNASSKQWLLRQINDKYVKQARIENWRCRSAFKLIEINEKCNILSPGMSVIDCGASPGSWSQVASKLVNSLGPKDDPKTGFVISLDRDFFQPIEGCLCVRNADISSKSTKDKIAKLAGGRVDVLLSDMAPNASGHKEMDHERIIDLNRHLLDFAMTVLNDHGTLVCKMWQGGKTRHFHSLLETMFNNVKVVKPEASRANSAEIFLVARDYVNPRLHCFNRGPS